MAPHRPPKIEYIGLTPEPTGEISYMSVQIQSHDDHPAAPEVVTLGADAVTIIIEHELDEDGAFQGRIKAVGPASRYDLAELFEHYAALLREGGPS